MIFIFSTSRRYLRLPRCRFQFSIISIFLVTAILSILLSIGATRAKRQRDAVNTLMQCGCDIEYAKPDSRFSNWLLRQGWLISIIGQDYFFTVECVSSRYGAALINQKEINQLVKLSDLKSLDFPHLQQSPGSLEKLRLLTDLEDLIIGYDELSDEDAKNISQIKSLQSLNLFSPSLTDEGMLSIGRMKNLKYLRIFTVFISAEGIAHLNALEKLQYLKLSTLEMEHAGFARITSLPELTDINLSDAPVNDETLKYLSGMNVAALDVRNTDALITNNGLRYLSQLPNLCWFRTNSEYITDEGLRHFSDMNNLTFLDLSGTAVKGHGLKWLTLPRLARLDLSNTLVTDEMVLELATLTALSEVNLENTTVSKGMIEKLKKLCPQLNVIHHSFLKRIAESHKKSSQFLCDSENCHEQSRKLLRLAVDEVIGYDKAEAKRLEVEVLSSKNDKFTDAVFDVIIMIYCERNDRDSLTRILSQRIPDRIGLHGTIEGYLTIVFGDKLRDGVLILCDAFEKSKSKEVRHQIAEALRRGFTAVGVKSEDDRVLVQRCRQWYLQNHAKYDLNREYLHKGIHPDIDEETHRLLSPDESRKRAGLFVQKGKAVNTKQPDSNKEKVTPETTKEPDKNEDYPDPFQ